MKKILSIAISFVIAFSGSAMALDYGAEWNGYEDNNAQQYSDVAPTHWAYDAINRATAVNWFSGYPDKSFRPNQSITREEAMKVIVTFLGLDLKQTTTSSYFDVDKTRWSSPFIEAGKLLFPEITTYNGQKPFQPEMPIKREDVMYALVIAKKYNNEIQFVDQSVLNMFKDQNSISSSLKPYVALAVNIGLVSGHANGTIGAQDPLTRAEFATMLYRATYIGDGTGGGLEAVATVESVTLGLPLVSELTVGDTLTITANAVMSDGTTVDYSSNLNPYNSSNNNVVLMNRNQITAVSEGTAVIKFNADDKLSDKSLVINVKPAIVSEPAEENNNNNNGNEDENEEVNEEENNYEEERESDAALVSFSWSVDELSLNKGDTARVKLIGTYSDGSQKDLTDEYTFRTSDDSVVTVDSNGIVKAVGVGSAKITYSASGITSVNAAAPLKVTVAAADNNDIVSARWSVNKVEIGVGETAEVKLLGVFSDGSTVDITEECSPFIDDESIAVFENGRIKGIAKGKTDLWFESLPNAHLVLPDLLTVTVE